MYGVILAFKNYKTYDGILGSEWTGWANFRSLFGYPYFWQLFKNTVGLSAYKLVISFPLTIIFALLINELTAKKFKRAVQTLSYLPYFISWMIIAGMAYNFFATDYGLFNRVLKALGMKTIDWYTTTSVWWHIFMVTSIWKNIGWGTIIYLAAMTSVNPELHQAAEIDGANRLRRVFSVTLPGMMPVIGITAILSISGLIRDDFEQIYALAGTRQVLYPSTETFGLFIYLSTMGDVRGYGIAAALGLFQGLIGLILIVGANYFVKRTDNPGLW